MKRLPKGVRKINKEEFSKKMGLLLEEKNAPKAHEKKEYVDWSENITKKSTKKTYRW